MSQYQIMQKNVEKIQSLGFQSEFDIEPYLLSEKEISKKILKDKNPQLSQSDVDLIVDDEDESIKKMEEEEELNANTEINDDSLSESEKSIRIEERRKRREERKQKKRRRIQQLKELYKSSMREISETARKMRKQIKIAFYNLIREVKTLLKKSITSLMQISTSIPAISLTVAVLPWNVPLAISFTMVLIDVILVLISQIQSMVGVSSSFDDLPFVTDRKNLSILSGIINSQLLAIVTLFGLLAGLNLLIKTLLGFVNGLNSADSKEKIFRKATKKLRKLGYFDSSNDSFIVDGQSIKADSEEDAYEIKGILDTYQVVGGNGKDGQVVDYKKNEETKKFNLGDKSLDNLLSELNLKLEPEIIVPTDFEDSNFYVYDVKLPDGRILLNQTEEDLEELKKIYQIVIDQIQDVTKTV